MIALGWVLTIILMAVFGLPLYMKWREDKDAADREVAYLANLAAIYERDSTRLTAWLRWIPCLFAGEDTEKFWKEILK